VLLPAKKPDFATRRLGVVILVMKNSTTMMAKVPITAARVLMVIVRAPIAGYPSCERQETFPVRAGNSTGRTPFGQPAQRIDVLSSYVRDADAFTDHAGAGLL
jgi:hypothetical protein